MRHGNEVDRFEWERRLQTQGSRCVAGVDEAGRGPLAGPVVAAAVMLPSTWVEQGVPAELAGLNDSKQVTEKRREVFYTLLTSTPSVRHAVAIVESEVIDQINILQATHRAMKLALAELIPAPDHVLIDGCPVPGLAFPHTALVKGDARSFSIAAASIVAKVTRDRLMVSFDERWPEYGFADHKGYGTGRHLEALRQAGPCPIHRRSFAPLRPAATPMELF